MMSATMRIQRWSVCSLGEIGCKNPVGVLTEVLLEELCELQEWWASGQGGTLHQTLLVEDKHVGSTWDHNATRLGNTTRLQV